MPHHSSRPEAGTQLEIIRAARRLNYYNGDKIIKTYPVAVGKPSTPTPLGSYKVVNKIIKPGDILGTRWMGLDIPNGPYGIHGTNNPSSIGKFISNGCIRMYNGDVEELFPKINIGTPVIITDGKGNAPPVSQEGKQYVVKPGDTLWKISQIYGVPLDDIIRANNLADPDILIPGQVLIIP
ncbi:MAG: L,D-transpeptidase family protein [Bacillota bacterium]